MRGVLDVFAGGKWKPTRIEYGDNWYLVGIRAEDLNGLRVRIDRGTGRTECPIHATKSGVPPKHLLHQERRTDCKTVNEKALPLSSKATLSSKLQRQTKQRSTASRANRLESSL